MGKFLLGGVLGAQGFMPQSEPHSVVIVTGPPHTHGSDGVTLDGPEAVDNNKRRDVSRILYWLGMLLACLPNALTVLMACLQLSFFYLEFVVLKDEPCYLYLSNLAAYNAALAVGLIWGLAMAGYAQLFRDNARRQFSWEIRLFFLVDIFVMGMWGTVTTGRITIFLLQALPSGLAAVLLVSAHIVTIAPHIIYYRQRKEERIEKIVEQWKEDKGLVLAAPPSDPTEIFETGLPEDDLKFPSDANDHHDKEEEDSNPFV
jgi:uncharacterized membrane protein